MTGSARRRVVRASGLLVFVGGLAVGAWVPSVGATSNDSSTTSYQVVGNKIIGPGGHQFVPYGFVLACLAERTYGCSTEPTDSDPLSDLSKIQASSAFWRANVVRIQVAPENLNSGESVSQGVLHDLSDEVRLANRLGMVAIITDQQEYFSGPPLPTATAVPFWNTIASKFKDDPAVFFDLFNEPRLGLAKGSGKKGSTYWNVWRNGGTTTTAKATRYDFVGMQTLLSDIRSDGAENIVIAEGLNVDKNLKGIPQYALSGTNVAYGMEPDLTPKDDTPEEWALNWGNLSKSVPIMMEAFQDWPGSPTCNVDSPTLLPQLLSYLKAMHLGLIVWTLNPGIMIVGNNLDEPTTYPKNSKQLCLNKPTKSATLGSNNNGPGQLILNFFRANSHPVPVPGSVTTSPSSTSPKTSTRASKPDHSVGATRGKTSGLPAVVWVVIAGAALCAVALIFLFRRRLRGRPTPR